MNPRAFSRDAGYDLTIALTYSFDPVFFERVVLHDLRVGGSGSVVVIGDPNEVAAAIEKLGWALDYLGRRYLLSAADHAKGAFHPKLMIRLGALGGCVYLGSGNLTSGGWGGNRELATSWKFGPDHADKGGWLIQLLTSIEGWCSGEGEKEIVSRSKSIPWVAALSSDATEYLSPILYSQPSAPLARQLEARWRGRQFATLKILTGSSDNQGAFLKWAHEIFGVKQVVVAGTIGALSFDAKKLSKLPFDVKICPIDGDVLHAKFYWFDGPRGSAAVVGSANCSAAAWLLRPDKGGNIETVLCFDTAKKEDFIDPLELISGKALAPEKVLLGSDREVDDDDDEVAKALYRLTSLDWNAQYGNATFILSPEPPQNVTVSLNIQGVTAKARRIVESGKTRFYSHFENDFGSGVLYGHAIIRMDGKEIESSSRWVDCLIDLENARSTTRIVDPLLGLEEEQNSSGQQKLVKTIQLVIQALFSGADNFPDSAVTSSQLSNRKSKEDRTADLIDPVKVLCDLSEIEAKNGRGAALRKLGAGSLSLAGILRLLFSDQRDSKGETIDPPTENEDDDPPSPPSKNQKKPTKVEERYAQRLVDQVSLFMDQLASAEFAEKCSATQFVQAVAFPLAVAELGRQHGWVAEHIAENWALRLFSILFRGRGRNDGLLNKVKTRYDDQGKSEIFAASVGDGALWSALAATIAHARWEGAAADFEKALAIRELFREPSLLSTAHSLQLQRYAAALRAREASAILRDHAPGVVSALESLEARVSAICRKHGLAVAGQHGPMSAGDLLWRDNVGWAFGVGQSAYRDRDRVRLRGNETEVMKGFYLNVTRLAWENKSIANLVQRVYTEIHGIQDAG